jgi:hypothetical protein
MLYSQIKVNLSLCLVKRYSRTFLTLTALPNVEASVSMEPAQKRQPFHCWEWNPGSTKFTKINSAVLDFLALTSLSSGGRSVGIVRSRTQDTEF